ncbi:MAG: hypothetical protein AAB470_02320 [Patescibacteria group bacterium]
MQTKRTAKTLEMKQTKQTSLLLYIIVKKRQTGWIKLGLVAFMLGAWMTALGQLPVINSFNQNGELVCTNLMPGSMATVLEAPTMTGPWTTNTDAIPVTSDGTFQLTGLVSPTGSKLYRVRGALNETNLSNDAWRALQASRLEDNQNYNRFGWTNMMTKIASGQNIRILLEGTGLVDYTPVGILDQVVYSLTNKFPIAGCFTTIINYWQAINVSGVSALLKSTNWYTWCGFYDTSDYAQFSSGKRVPWNVVQVDYLEQPSGGDLGIYTNNTSVYGNYQLATTLNTYAATTNGRTAYFTNAGGAVFNTGSLMLSNISGVNWVVNSGIHNTTVSNGIVIGKQAAPNARVAYMNQVKTNNRGPIYAAWKPDLILFQVVDYVDAPSWFSTNIAPRLSFYTNVCPGVSVVLCGAYPFPGTPDTDLQDCMRTNAVNYGMSYFDGYSPFQSFTNVCYPRGFTQGLTNMHYSPEGMMTYGYFLSKWLGL